ncbi:MAG TPA: hypothetical protein VF867_15265 [Arthrobacter sp.]
METALAFDYPTAPPPRISLCDLCGADPHPEYVCLWRRYRTLLRVPAGAHHFSDDIHAAIAGGSKPEEHGTQLLRRMLARAAAHKDAHGVTGSVQELEDDRNADRPAMTRL